MLINNKKKYAAKLFKHKSKITINNLNKKEESFRTYKDKNIDGLTILRYTHAYKNAGGMEQHLEDLNRALLQRNKMTIIQLTLPENNLKLKETIQKIGSGTFINVPMMANENETGRILLSWYRKIIIKLKFKYIIRDLILYNPFFPQRIRKSIIKRMPSYYGREPLNAREKIREILDSYDISLIIIHTAGSFGSAQVINEAQKKKIPCLILNHFHNRLLKMVGTREQITCAAGVGGLSSKHIPKYIMKQYTNLSSGIDTDFFKKENAKALTNKFDLPVILLPARIVTNKGHADLLKAAYRLKKEGMNIYVVFIGRLDLPEFKCKLEKLVKNYKLSNNIIFVGQLSQEELRDWYAISKIVVLPSYHDEGLPRVLLEAQAMNVPVIAYNVGGVSEALINGITGYIVKKGNIRGLVLRLKELLRDNDKRMAMRQSGRNFVENNFNFSALAQRHEAWYLGAIYK